MLGVSGPQNPQQNLWGGNNSAQASPTNSSSAYTNSYNPSDPYSTIPYNTQGSNSGNNWASQAYGFYGQQPAATAVTNLGEYTYPLAMQEAQFAGQLEPTVQQGIQGIVNQANPAGLNADIAQYGNQAQETAGNNAREAGLMGAASGEGQGAIQGQQNQAFNQATAGTNQFAANVYNPQARMQQLQQSIQAALGGQQTQPAEALQLQSAQSELGQGQFNNQVNNQNASLWGNTLGQLGGFLGNFL